jgi:hypothetical protein
MLKCVVSAPISISGTIVLVTRFGQDASGHKKQKGLARILVHAEPYPEVARLFPR